MKRLISQATGKMKPCHRPRRKPGAAGATAAAVCVAQAEQPAFDQAQAEREEYGAGEDEQKPELALLAEAAHAARLDEHDQPDREEDDPDPEFERVDDFHVATFSARPSCQRMLASKPTPRQRWPPHGPQPALG
jgi:hypothetical protein